MEPLHTTWGKGDGGMRGGRLRTKPTSRGAAAIPPVAHCRPPPVDFTRCSTEMPGPGCSFVRHAPGDEARIFVGWLV